MTRTLSRCLACALGLIATLAHAQTEDLLYSVVDVGPWGNPRFAGRALVNEAGQVTSKGANEQAYLWTNGTGQDLGVLPDGTESTPGGINDRGQVAGASTLDNNPFDFRAFLWKDGSMQNLGQPAGGNPSQATGVNDSGWVSGWSYVTTPTGSSVHAVLWREGGMTDLGTLPVEPENAGFATSSAAAVSDTGAVVGESDVAGGGRHAFFWKDGVMQDLGVLEGGSFSSARDVNNRDEVVGIADTAGGAVHAVVWRNGVIEDLGLLGGAESVAEAINDDGLIVGYTQLANGRFHAFLFEDGVMKDLNNSIDNTGVPAWSELVRATDINNRGDIVGYGDRGSRRTFLLRKLCRDADGNGNPDNDGDALCDNWEVDGIDVDGNGIVDLRLYDLNQDGTLQPAERADPNHKDVYVEVDWMALHKPEPAALARVVAAFAAAPVPNPDGTTGIRLHLLADEQAVFHFDEMAFGNDLPGQFIPHFDAVKDAAFGTAAERGASTAAERLAAKRLAFRYSLFAHQLRGVTWSGLSELPGNDFLVSLGAFAEVLGHRTGSVDQQAGTFMHELGHALNLRHGGGDNFNCKPNYLSVMSYSRQFDNDPIVNRPLDYSRQALATLDESALFEPAGIGGPAGSSTVFGPLPFVVVAGDGPINWSRDLDATDTGITANINRLTTLGCDGAGAVLAGLDDWSSLVYDFRASPDFADGVHATVAADYEELTPEEALELSPDTDGDGVTNLLDNCVFTPNVDQADADADSVGDACDNCSAEPNVDQRDTNGDGYGNVCDADLNNSGGLVNAADLALFRTVFGQPDADADFNGSGGLVNAADLAWFRTLFGKPVGPSGLHLP